MTPQALKEALYTIIQPIMAETVIWPDQNAPRPALPYSTLRLSSITRQGTPHYSDVDNNGIQTVIAIREAVLQVQRFGDASVEALETLSEKLDLVTNLDKLYLQKIAVFDKSPVTDVAQLLGGLATEPRASIDLSIRWKSSLTDNVGLIETVHVDGEVGPIGTANNRIYDVIVN